ncbi:MAG: hypothetical protein V3V00_04745 [Saprospiraceae bacterium]
MPIWKLSNGSPGLETIIEVAGFDELGPVAIFQDPSQFQEGQPFTLNCTRPVG